MRKNNTETNCNVSKKILQNQQKWKHAVMHNLLCGSSRYLNLSTLDSALFYYWNFSTLDSSLLYFFFLILKLIRWPLFQHLSSTRKFLTVCFDLIQMMPFFTTFLHLNTKVFDHNTKILHWFCDILSRNPKFLKRIANLLQWFSIIL